MKAQHPLDTIVLPAEEKDTSEKTRFQRMKDAFMGLRGYHFDAAYPKIVACEVGNKTLVGVRQKPHDKFFDCTDHLFYTLEELSSAREFRVLEYFSVRVGMEELERSSGFTFLDPWGNEYAVWRSERGNFAGSWMLEGRPFNKLEDLVEAAKIDLHTVRITEGIDA